MNSKPLYVSKMWLFDKSVDTNSEIRTKRSVFCLLHGCLNVMEIALRDVSGQVAFEEEMPKVKIKFPIFFSLLPTF